MPSMRPTPLLASLVVLMVATHTVFWGIPIQIIGLAKLATRDKRRRERLTAAIIALVNRWIAGILLIMRTAYAIDWRIRGTDGLSPEKSYIVLSNHQAWTDMPILLQVFTGRIPFFRIFAKQEILWLPIIGTSLLTLDFPIMKRYSREHLERHPESRGRDLETARRMCRRFRSVPASILIFAEGTRFRESKHERQRSPYRHLLKPKTGALAFTLDAMEGRITGLLDVTIAYPPPGPSFRDFLCGRLEKVAVEVNELTIPEDLLRGDYRSDPQIRKRLQQWIEALWAAKDERIDRLRRRMTLPDDSS